MKHILILLISAICTGTYAQSNCSEGHCSRISERMNKFCIANGMSGKPYLVLGPNGEDCYCPCSCVADETFIALKSKWSLFGNLRGDERVATPLSDSKLTTIHKIYSTDMSDHPIKLYKVVFENESSILVSKNHTFITHDQRVVSADKLKIGHDIISDDGSTKVQKIDIIDNYRGLLMNVSVNAASSRGKDHVLFTNGVASGDLLLQSSLGLIDTEIEVRLNSLKVLTDD